MPVEINELVVRGVVQRQADGGAASDADDSPTAGPDRALIDACVKEVLRILRRSKER